MKSKSGDGPPSLPKPIPLIEQVELYARLKASLEYFSATEIAEFDASAATVYQRLLRAKIRIGTMDLKIASIALSRNVTLWTRNIVDFAKIPDLRVFDAAKSDPR
jgi:tRNA(fMet)-specific endonuclease VapC